MELFIPISLIHDQLLCLMVGRAHCSAHRVGDWLSRLVHGQLACLVIDRSR